MLKRINSPDGVVTYISPQLADAGIPHGFSTRIGGISSGPFDSLNLGNPNGCPIQDDLQNIRQNYQLFLRAAGCAGRDRVWLHQVHSNGVVRIEAGKSHFNDTKADALVTDDPNRALSIRVADCVPVLLARDDGQAVAAVHAGWRGVVSAAALQAIKELNRTGDCPANRLIAAIGPSIGFDAFEVGSEVLDEFVQVFGNDVPVRHAEPGKGRVDLRECLRRQLIDAGVKSDRIDVSDRCTYRDANEFFSHRRDKGVTGRMSAVIAAPKTPAP
jgi:hypothetical protein